MPFQNHASRDIFYGANFPLTLIAALFVFGGLSPAVRSVASPAAGKPARLELQPCHVPEVKEELRCGVYNVPEDRSLHGRRMLPLRVVVSPARSKHPAREPVFYFEGGPGEPATESVSYLRDSSIQENRDIVFIDQRGTGEGHRLDCPRPGDGKDLQVYLQPLYVVRGCAAKLGQHADLTQYATPTAMQDIDEIRQALGYDKVLVYGGSYGARAAMIYMRMYGEHVQAGIIGAITPLAIRLPLYFARDSQRAFDSMLAECAAQPACKAAYPDPKRDLEAARLKLRQQPARITIKSPITGAPTEVSVTERAFVDAIHGMQYSMEETRNIPLALHRAREGDFTQLMEHFITVRWKQADEVRFGMFMAVVCSEDVARVSPVEAEKEARGSYFGPGMARDLMASCAEWPRARLPRNYFTPFQSNVPVLMISGDLDPATPPVWGEEARRSFPNSLHLVMHDAHSGGGECADSIERQFLSTMDFKKLDTACVKSAPTQPFTLPETTRTGSR
jgi:pimeloyl-ACP methyl ester carboxylesterase